MSHPAATDSARLRDLATKSVDGGRLSSDEALVLYRGLDQPSLGICANDVRMRMHPVHADGKARVSYIVDRNLNPTNVCVTDCGFCAFYRRPGDAEGYVLPRDVIYQKVEECRQALERRDITRAKQLYAELRDDFAKVKIDPSEKSALKMQ
jgi:2-iminoacetate synthase ThiH